MINLKECLHPVATSNKQWYLQILHVKSNCLTSRPIWTVFKKYDFQVAHGLSCTGILLYLLVKVNSSQLTRQAYPGPHAAILIFTISVFSEDHRFTGDSKYWIKKTP